MKIGYGRSRLLIYGLWGAFIAAALVGIHDFLDHYINAYHESLLLLLIPGFALALALLARRENEVYQWGSRMDAARLRVNDLMLHATDRQNWVPSFSEEGLATCWQELDCDKTDCPAYGIQHARCWLVAGTFCRGEVQGKFAKKLHDCRLCPVYQKATADPVREITENFYAMTYLLGEREEQLEKAYDEASDRGKKLSGLVALSEAALSSMHMGEVLQNLLSSAATIVGADFGCVSQVDSAGEQLGARVCYGLSPGSAGKINERVGEGIIGRAFAGSYIAVSEDLSVDSRFINPHIKSMQVRTLISLPLVGRGQPLGMLTLGTYTPHHYTDEEKDSLCVAADRIAAAIENSQLERELSRDRGQVELIDALTQDLAAQQGMSSIYESFVAHAGKLIDFDRASLEMWVPASDEVEIAAMETQSSRTWLEKGLRLPRLATPTSAVMETGRTLVRQEITGNEYPSDKLLMEEGIRSAVLLPLFSAGSVIGTVTLGSFLSRGFDEKDLELLEPLVRQLGLVVDNTRLVDETRRLTLTDSLTDLFDHRYFYESVNREIGRAERHHEPVAMMILDVDGFKEYNDQHGHLEGDKVLRMIAQTLRGCVRDLDVLSRYGGDEFAILMPELAASDSGAELDALRVAERIRETMAGNRMLAARGPVTLSIGIASCPDLAMETNQLFERASWALREAKAQGKDRIVVARRLDDRAGDRV